MLHLCDSLFPVGGFAYSDGLEAATASGAIANAMALGDWMDVCLDDLIARSEGPTLLLAWSAFHERDWDAIAQLDAEVTALRPSATARRASRAMGLRLAATWQALYPDAALARLVTRAPRRRDRPRVAGRVCGGVRVIRGRPANIGGGVCLQSPRGDDFVGDASDANRADRGAPRCWPGRWRGCRRSWTR